MIRTQPGDLAIDVAEIASPLVAVGYQIVLVSEDAGVVRGADDGLKCIGDAEFLRWSLGVVVDGIGDESGELAGGAADHFGDLGDAAVGELFFILALCENELVIGWGICQYRSNDMVKETDVSDQS